MDWLSPMGGSFEFVFAIPEQLSVPRAILGFILVFFLPGLAWTFVFFRQIKVIERVALSFGLSIAIVTLSILFANMVIGVRITGFNSVLVIILVTILHVAIYYLNRFVRRRRGSTTQD